jgi:hypothetical protein
VLAPESTRRRTSSSTRAPAASGRVSSTRGTRSFKSVESPCAVFTARILSLSRSGPKPGRSSAFRPSSDEVPAIALQMPDSMLEHTTENGFLAKMSPSQSSSLLSSWSSIVSSSPSTSFSYSWSSSQWTSRAAPPESSIPLHR